MLIFDLLLEPDLDILRFPKHKTGWGARYPDQGIFTPHPVLLTCHAICYLDNKIKQLFYGTITHENI